MIRIVATSSTIALPDGFCWHDEFAWGRKAQVHKRLLPDLDGKSALLIQQTTKKGGKPLTLGGPDGAAGFMPRSMVEALTALAEAEPPLEVTVEMDGRDDRLARFDFSAGPAVDARPVISQEPPAADDWYFCTLHLMES